MSKRKWYTKATYLAVALALCLGLTMVPAVAGQDDEEAMGYVEPSLAVNVKGACEEFCSYAANTTNPLAPDKWDILPGVKNPQAVVVEGELGPDPLATECITIRALTPGDVHVQATYSDNSTAKGEKKWGVIEETELTALNVTGKDIEVDGDVVVVAGTDAKAVSEEIRDTVTAWYYWGEEVEPHEYTTTAAHAVVHWWIFDKAKLTEEGLLDDLQDLGGCGKYLIVGGKVEWEDAAPYDLLEDIYRLGGVYYTGAGTNTDTAAVETKFLDGVAGTDGPPADDCNVEYVDGAAYPTIKSKKAGTSGATDLYTADGIGTTDTYIKTMTRDDEYDPVLNPLHGTTDVTVENTGEEEVVIVTLVEYPWEFNGENPVCVEIGYKKYIPVIIPEVCQIKAPQVRWAGEKIVLEKDWGDVGSGRLVGFFLEEGTIGNMIPFPEYHGDNPSGIYLLSGDARTVFTVTDCDGIARAMFETEQQGQVDVKCVLYSGGYLDAGMTIEGITQQLDDGLEVAGNHGFLVYYLALEDVDVDTDLSDLTAIDAGENADVVVKVRGWFTRDDLESDRPRGDADGDGLYELPAGRIVLPDDWAALAGSDEATSSMYSRPQYDLMNTPDGTIVSDPLVEWGAYDGATLRTTTPPGEAEYATIGPFSTLQPWNCVDDEGNPTNMWIAEDVVQADYKVTTPDVTPPAGAPPPNNHWELDDLRNTVVPDGTIDEADCPMPQALVTFEVTGTELASLDKGNVFFSGTGADKVYTAPFYAVEIPSHWLIPSFGYSWDSWGLWTGALTDDGPYDFWDDLRVTPSEDDDDILEVYSDNHGYAGVTIDGEDLADEYVTLNVIADFPVMAAKYPAVDTTREVCWGIAVEHLNPDFEVDPREDEAPCTITFYGLKDGTGVPWTTGGVEAYVKAVWDFDDGTPVVEVTGATSELTLVTQYHEYAYAGTYSPSLTVTDSSEPALVHTEKKWGYIVLTGEEPPAGFWPSDIDESGEVNIWDFYLFAEAYGSKTGEANWNALCDLVESGEVDIEDFFVFAVDYGEHSV